MKSIIFLTFSVFMCTSSWAVDGYKDLKFGSTLKQVKETKICSLSNDFEKQGDVKVYRCQDFLFNDKPTEANFNFVDDKLQRVGFKAGEFSDLDKLSQSIMKKHGDASDDIKFMAESFDMGLTDSVDLGFDKETVILRLQRNNKKENLFLIYTSSAFPADGSH